MLILCFVDEKGQIETKLSHPYDNWYCSVDSNHLPGSELDIIRE